MLLDYHIIQLTQLNPSLEVDLFQFLGSSLLKLCKKVPSNFHKIKQLENNYSMWSLHLSSFWIWRHVAKDQQNNPLPWCQKPKIRARDPDFFSNTGGRWSLFHFRCKTARLYRNQLNTQKLRCLTTNLGRLFVANPQMHLTKMLKWTNYTWSSSET